MPNSIELTCTSSTGEHRDDHVEGGQVLAQIGRKTFELAVRSARADLANAGQQVGAQTARIGVAEALRFPSLTLGTALRLAGAVVDSSREAFNQPPSWLEPLAWPVSSRALEGAC